MDQIVGTFPDYIDEDKIESNNLVDYLKSNDRLKYLKQLYFDDIDKFYNVRDELLLRGMKFKVDLIGNFFPKQKFEPTLIISVEKNDERFKLIDRNILDVHQLNNRFQISNDIFFDGISIEGLANFFDKKVSLIKLAINNAGFKILPTNQYTMKRDKSIIAEPTVDSTTYPKENISNKLDDLNTELNSSKFKLFTRYLNELGVDNIYGLNSQIVNGYENYKGVGKGRFDDANDLWKRVQKELDRQLVVTTDSLDDNLNAIVNNRLRNTLEKVDYSYIKFLNELYGNTEEDSNYDWQKNKEKVEKEFKNYLTNNINDLKLRLRESKRSTLLNKIKDEEAFNLVRDIEASYVIKKLNIEFEDDQIPTNVVFSDFIENEKVTNDLLDNIDYEIHRLKSIQHIMDDFTKKNSEKYLKISLLRHRGLTLQEIGIKNDVTREGIRQIDKRTVQNLIDSLNEPMSFYINYLLSKQAFVKVNGLEQYFGLSELYAELTNIYLENSDDFCVEGSYIITKNFNQQLQKFKNQIEDNHQMILKDEDIYEMISDSDAYELNHDFIDYVMKSMNYRSVDGLYVDMKARLTEAYAYIFKNYIHGSLRIDDAGYEFIRKIYEKYFTRDFPNSKRALAAALDRTKNIIETNSLEYMYFDFDEIDEKLLNEIKNKLDNELSIRDVINGKAFFAKYDRIWKEYGITTALFLYKIIRNYYSEDYIIGRGNTLEISKLNTKKLVKYKQLEKYLVKMAQPVAKKKILDDLHWESYVLDQVVSKSSEIIASRDENGDGFYQSMNLYRYTNKDKDDLKNYITNYMGNKRYIWTNQLYKDILFKSNVSDLIATRQFELYDFSNLVKNLLPGLKGYEQFLYYDNFSQTGNELLVSMLDNIFSKDNIKELMEPRGYSPQSIGMFPKRIIDNGNIIKYDINEYIKVDSLKINDDTLKRVQYFLDDLFKQKWYMSATDILGTNILSDICPDDVEMTAILLISIANKYLDYQYFCPNSFINATQTILVSKSTSIGSYAELIYEIMLSRGLQEKSYTQGEFIRYLSDNHFYIGHNLPNSLSTSNFFNISDIGIITLKQGDES